jgi:hypothetical protein
VTRRGRLPPLPAREADLAPIVQARLEAEGFTVRVNPDGSDYFDLVGRRGDEIGLVELKKTDWQHLLAQAVARRAYGDWVVAALARRTAAEKLVEHASSEPARAVGVWSVVEGRIEVLRPARPWSDRTKERFRDQRAALRGLLDALDAGLVPEGASWGGFPWRTAWEAGGRHAREWRLDEYDTADDDRPSG